MPSLTASHPLPIPPATELEAQEQQLMRLEQENRWLKRYLGETLKELHVLQQRVYGGKNGAWH